MWYESPVNENSSATDFVFSGPFPEINDYNDNFRFALMDRDDGDDQEITWVLDYYLYHSYTGFPAYQELVFEDGSRFVLTLEYDF